ncbi:myosin [Sarcoptes scabiei]|nr:myosin [Sarcoptes scabiei]
METTTLTTTTATTSTTINPFRLIGLDDRLMIERDKSLSITFDIDNESCQMNDSIYSDDFIASYQNLNLFMDLGTILTAIFYGSAFILGTIGNSLIIYIVAHYSRMRTLSNVFLASLAIADLLLVCVCIPIKFIQLITYTWTFGVFMCKAIHYVQSVSAYCSVLTLTTISVERYYAIIHPVRCRVTFSMRHIRKMICVTWILAAIMASPTIGIYMLERIGHEFESDHFWCVKIDSDWATVPDLRQKWFEARVVFEIYQILTILVLPTLVMIFTYASVCIHLWTVLHHRTAMRFGHSCHLSFNSSISKPSSATATVMTTSSGTSTGTSAFTSSFSSASNTLNHCNHSNHHYVQMPVKQNSLPEIETNLFPPTPTSIASFQSQYSRKSRLFCQQCYQQLKSNDEDNQTVKQVIKMLVAVVVLFVLCWAPTLIIGLLRAFNLIAETNEGILREIITVTFLLSYLNSVINPIIYGFMSKNFRMHFGLIFNQIWTFLTAGHCNDANIRRGHRKVKQQNSNLASLVHKPKFFQQEHIDFQESQEFPLDQINQF